tara:strand:- start:526 stop:747 length:222 start_codon:yes stop_codon:yes gene_type:complete
MSQLQKDINSSKGGRMSIRKVGILNRIIRTEKIFEDELSLSMSGGAELAKLKDNLMKHLSKVEFEDKELDEIS